MRIDCDFCIQRRKHHLKFNVCPHDIVGPCVGGFFRNFCIGFAHLEKKNNAGSVFIRFRVSLEGASPPKNSFDRLSIRGFSELFVRFRWYSGGKPRCLHIVAESATRRGGEKRGGPGACPSGHKKNQGALCMCSETRHAERTHTWLAKHPATSMHCVRTAALQKDPICGNRRGECRPKKKATTAGTLEELLNVQRREDLPAPS